VDMDGLGWAWVGWAVLGWVDMDGMGWNSLFLSFVRF